MSPSFSVCIKAATWNRDSHGLFDYEDQTVNFQTLFSRQCEYLVRVPNEGGIQLMPEKDLTKNSIPPENILLKITPNNEDPKSFIIDNCSKTSDYEEATDKLWLITKSLKDDGQSQVLIYIIIALQT